MKSLVRKLVLVLGCLFLVSSAFANLAGGGNGTGSNVTLSDSGNGTVTMANGIVSIVCNTNSGVINQINYTFNNTGTPQTLNLLAGGHDGGRLYWEDNNNQGLTFSYSVVSDPAANGGNYAEIVLTTTTVSNIVLQVHYSMLRGSTGFYVTAIYAHRRTDGAFSFGECRDNIYAGSIFNWMSVDATRNRLMEVQPGSGAVSVFGAPKEVSLWTNGIYAGQYEDKYKYSADLGVNHVWGWSSVGNGGKNVGLWNITASPEYYNGGPLKRELMEHIGTTILNMLNGGHYGQGHDGAFAAGEVWTKVYGPYFIYCNNISDTITNAYQASQALYADALTQRVAERSAWPYAWFTNANYAPAADRGTVAGKIVIHDIYNPNASASNLWVGLVRQPVTITGAYDFQAWMKPYQFWTRTDAAGNFTLPNVIATNNYTLYAFGPGAPEMFMSQKQTGGNPPLLFDVPASPFSVTVAGGATNKLGTVTWTPARVGPTVFQIGYPNRTSDKFRHGDDWWVGNIGPDPADPSPIWSKWLEYPFDFPNGVNYVVGQSRWTTGWNFVQPVVASGAGAYNNSSSTITFNLATAPANGAVASLYLGLSSDFYAAIIVTVNGHNLGSVSGVTGSPNNSIPTTGYYPGYSDSDTTIREGNQAMASDERLTFPASILRQGQNTITIGIRQIGGSYFADDAMYDYIRLELTGYVPPPPASVAAYAGNSGNLIAWPVQPGATSYNILRSTASGGGYVPIATGLTGPVCGSGWNDATYLDTNAVNGTTYYYVVQSVNPVGASADSPQSSGATPSAAISANPPPAPTGLTVSGVGHHLVTLDWNPSAGADFYTIYRSTLFNNGGGASNVLGAIVLANNVTGSSYADTSPSDGTIYRYTVAATGAGGTSPDSAPVVAVPLPPPPANPPADIVVNGGAGQTSYFISWQPVAGAVGYIVRRSTSSHGPFNYVMSITETNWPDAGLNANAQYFYTITAVNAAGTAPSSVIAGPPGIPASLTAVPGNSAVLLNWSPSPGATSYVIKRGTSSGNETATVATGVTATSYTDTGLANGTTYYYVVQASGTGGLSGNSPEARATPGTTGFAGLVWSGATSSMWDTTSTNWLDGLTPTNYVNGDVVTFDDSGVSANVVVSNSVSPALVTFTNATLNYIVSSRAGGSGIAGAGSLIKNGAGSLTLNSANAYSGGTTLNAGTLVLANANAAGTNTITLNGGTLVLGAIVANPINIVGTATLLPGSIDYNDSPLSGSGQLDVTITGNNTFSPGANMSGFSGTIELGASSGYFRFYGSLGSAAAAFDLGVGSTTMLNRNGNATIQLGSLAGGANTTLSGASAINGPTTYVVGSDNINAIYAGRITDGAGTTAIVKTGLDTWTLAGASTYSGGTSINSGALIVDDTTASATGSGAVTVARGGTLGGNGIIAGPVAVDSGGTLAPGSPFDCLTISNNLTLSAGGTTIIPIQASPAANASIFCTGHLTEGGALEVSNLSGTLANGDTFQLFSAPGYTGAFNSFVLPPLSGNLVWNTHALNVSGTLSVVALTSPMITRLNMSNGHLVVSGTGGASDWPFEVLETTNLTLPAAEWTPVTTNQFGVNGNFVITNAINPAWSQTFYRLQLQ